MRIGLLSDTHGWLDERLFHHFKECDEVWHAGDIGSLEIATRLATFKPLRAVHGNIDGQNIRREYPADQHFMCGGMQVWITHIGGKPPYYTPAVCARFEQEVPDIFVCGHSHILRVIHDVQHPPLLYLNPGAAGREGHHQVRTLLRFTLQDKRVSEMQVVELGKRGDGILGTYA